MGCNAFHATRYTSFILEVEVDGTADNDGIGITFGYNGPNDYFRAESMNDAWPNPAADGVGGPFMKIKKKNANPCVGSMTSANNCYDTLAYLTNHGATNFNHP